ncbi:hypothetical protein D3C72_1369400 [compost metagenome]
MGEGCSAGNDDNIGDITCLSGKSTIFQNDDPFAASRACGTPYAFAAGENTGLRVSQGHRHLPCNRPHLFRIKLRLGQSHGGCRSLALEKDRRNWLFRQQQCPLPLVINETLRPCFRRVGFAILQQRHQHAILMNKQMRRIAIGRGRRQAKGEDQKRQTKKRQPAA